MGGAIKLPRYIRRNRYIKSFEKKQNGKWYKDDLCFFRCLTDHFHPILFNESTYLFNKKVRYYYRKWIKFNEEKGNHINSFTGVNLSEMSLLEICFQVNN